jgi:hypothetical protein
MQKKSAFMMAVTGLAASRLHTRNALCATQKLTLKKNSSLEEGLLFGYCTFYYFNGQFQSTINNQN